ncbi:MAG: carbohydrate-binding family 9-like protein [Acidobacteriota bacterium]
MALMYRDADAPPLDAVYRAVHTLANRSRLLVDRDPAWAAAHAISWGPQAYRTTFRALWNAGGLAVRFDAIDDRPWHTMARHDDPIAEEEAVEIFLDPARAGHHYVEVEISPINVVTDLRVFEPWPNLRGDRAWDWTGLESAVMSGMAAGLPPGSWVAVAWLPWEGLHGFAPSVESRVPPSTGDRWRFNVFRIKRPHGPAEPERDAIYAAWSAPDGPSFHAPAFFRDIIFE